MNKRLLLPTLIIVTLLLMGDNNMLFGQSNDIPRPPSPPTKVKQKADKGDEELARQYFYNNEFEKALPYYEKLAKKNPRRNYFTDRYIECLDRLGQQENAIKFLKKKLKKTESSPNYYVSLAYLYSQLGDSKNKKRNLKKAKEIGIKNPIYLNTIANEFTRRRFPNEAIDMYHKAFEKTKDANLLLRIGDIQRIYGNYSEMITVYLEYLDQEPEEIQAIKNKLQSALDKDKEEAIAMQLKKSLVRRVQEYPRKVYFSELLLWFSIQKKDFSMAYTQAKALDKRLKEGGERVLDLGNICTENQDYSTAIKAADYVLKKGKNSPYYFDALSLKIESNYQKIIETPDPLEKDVLSLEEELKGVINEYGISQNTLSLLISLSHIQTFYLGKETEAIPALEKAINQHNISSIEQAYVKMELADEYLYTDEVWEASLLYSQVEKAFPHNPIAAEAKYRNAKLSFYIGEFEWAKTQLLVLKAATSKLIANDALFLTLLINENKGENTSMQALKYYGKASYFLFQKKPNKAIETLDSIFTVGFFHPMFDDALLLKAKIYLEQKEYLKAEEVLHKLISDYAHEITTDDALWLVAKLYDNELINIEKAKNAYFQIIKDHPDSIYAEEARGRYRALRGDISSE